MVRLPKQHSGTGILPVAVPVYTGGKPVPLSRRGQVLLLAVMIMFAMLLVGALFVAIITYNQQSSVRHSDVVAAQNLAEAGIRLADRMLQFSTLGADWRPPFFPGVEPPILYTTGVPENIPAFYDYYTEQEEEQGWCPLVDSDSGQYIRFGYSRYPNPADASGGPTIGRGHFLLRVTYDPDPPYEPNDPPGAPVDPLSKFIKIESIGVVDDEGFVFRRLIAYKPISLTDYLLFVTDKDRRAQPTILGFNPWVNMDNDGELNWDDFDFLRQRFDGPLRFNTPVQLEGQNGTPTNQLVGRASLTIALTRAPVAQTGPNPGGLPGESEGGGYLRADRLETPYGIEGTFGGTAVDRTRTGDGQQFIHSSDDPSFDSYKGAVLDGSSVPDVHGWPRQVRERQAPDLFAQDPATGTMRWYALTRDSGEVVARPGGSTFNTGQFGHGQGIYIDNGDDIQFDHDINALIQDWLHNLQPGTLESGWNPVGEVYDQAYGVEIELFPTEDATIEDPYDTGGGGTYLYIPDPDASPDAGLPAGTIWWPDHVSGEPGIRLERRSGDGGYDDGYWCIADPNDDSTVGDTAPLNTRVMYLDYPQAGHQVIFAEGNIRIKGRLPRDDSGTGAYNLTVVSGGTIYIDGQLLSPQDQLGRDATGTSGSGIRDEENTYIALLARDCVVVNPTMLVPQGRYQMVREADDGDPNQYHWVVQGGATTPYMHSRWYWGAPPVGGSTVNLVVRQTRAEGAAWDSPTQRGPVAAARMQLYSGGATQYYPFDNAGAAGPSWDPYAFVLAYGQPVPAELPGNDGTIGDGSGPYVPQQWAPRNVRPWVELADTSGHDATPWNLTDYIATPAGVLNGITISPLLQNDPFFVPFLNPVDAMPYSFANYWLKKFKIEEVKPSPTGKLYEGAIHAKINALMYAENGCFFVIPGPYFDEDETGPNTPRFRRYNYDIEIRGAITENFHPGPAAVREWHDKWAYPAWETTATGAFGEAWRSIRYVYDETILAARQQATTTVGGPDHNIRSSAAVLATNEANLPKLPLLPVSPDLIYYGEVQ